jgi:hypothetical protein
MTNDAKMDERLRQVLEESGFTSDTILFRESLEDFLSQDPDTGAWTIAANPDPSEAVVNVYEGGATSLAAQIGPGLAFTTTSDSQWSEDGRTTVAVRLGDVLKQGGRIYPVLSVITEPVFYLTLPAGRVQVSKV